jgi:hypothetical protein
MKRHFIKAGFLVLAFNFGLLSGPAYAQSLTWWVELATRKVMQDRAPQPVREIVLEAARNEYEPFQVVIRADGGDLNNVDAWVGDLVGPKGAVIPWYNIELYRAYYVTVTNPSGNYGQGDGIEMNPRQPGEYVDPLIPFFDPYDPRGYAVGTPFDVSENSLQPIFGDIHIPLDVPAGEYKGILRITVGFVVAAEIPVTLRVWNFTLPRERRVTTGYHMYFNRILRYHGGSDGAYDDESLEIIRNYEETMHRFRIDLRRVIQGPPSLPSPFFTFDPEGNLTPPDYTAYDAHMEPRLTGTRYDDGVAAAMASAELFGLGYSRTLTDDEYIQAAADFARHLKEKGWWKRVFIQVYNEPWLYPGSYDKIAYDVALMSLGDPDWITRMMVNNHWVEELQYSIGIWCPLTSNYDHWNWSVPEYTREDYQRLIAEGYKLWFYVCNATVPPYAGYDIDTIWGHEPRILKWGAWYEGATGFLYYCTNCCNKSDPWGTLLNLVDHPQFARNGDGFLLYPGDHDGTAGGAGSPPEISMDGPVITHRLMMIREGMEDWDYFLLAEDMGGKHFAREVVEGVYTQLGINQDDYDPEDPPWTYDEAELYGARHQLGEWINAGGYGKPGHDGDDDDDGYFGCSVNFCKPQGKVVSFVLVIILILALQLVLRINHRWIQ